MEHFTFLSGVFGLVGSQGFGNAALAIGVLVAVKSVNSMKQTARRTQTAVLLFGTRSDEQLSKGYKRLQALHDSPDQNIRVFAKPEKRDSEEANDIRYVLNHWERVCVGINQGIYCEKMLREANHGTVTNLYDRAKPFIEAVRAEEGRQTYYQELQHFAERWKDKPLKARNERMRW